MCELNLLWGLGDFFWAHCHSVEFVSGGNNIDGPPSPGQSGIASYMVWGFCSGQVAGWQLWGELSGAMSTALPQKRLTTCVFEIGVGLGCFLSLARSPMIVPRLMWKDIFKALNLLSLWWFSLLIQSSLVKFTSLVCGDPSILDA